MSNLGDFFRGIAEDCDRTCGGVDSKQFEDMARLQLNDHEDIKTLKTIVLAMNKKLESLTKDNGKPCKVVSMQNNDSKR